MPSALLVSQPTTEGVAVCVRDLAAAAVSDGWRVTVACPAGGRLAEWATEVQAAWVEVPMDRTPGPRDAGAVARVRRLIQQHDLVHLHSSKAGAVGRLALASIRPARRPPTLFTPNAWSWLVGGRAAILYRTVERRLAPLTDAIVAVSDEERAEGVAVLGAGIAGRMHVIPNGADVVRFAPEGPAAPRSEAPLIVCVGRLAHQKGQDVAVRALAAMRTPGARLRLVGSGPDEADLRRLAASLGVDARVELAGESRDPSAHLRGADVVVVPSRWDGMSLSLLEAMACGRPIVATRVPGASALDGAGVVVEPEDVAQMATAVDDLLFDAGRRATLGRAARTRAVEQYSAERRMGEVVALWRTLLR